VDLCVLPQVLEAGDVQPELLGLGELAEAGAHRHQTVLVNVLRELHQRFAADEDKTVSSGLRSTNAP
jgi:hypothetical protein